LGVEFEESMVVQKVLRSLSMRFDRKISSLEESTDLGTLSMDELHGIFKTYEMRIEHENPITKEIFQGIQEDKEEEKEKVKTRWQL
jgi:hypothetical protein